MTSSAPPAQPGALLAIDACVEQVRRREPRAQGPPRVSAFKRSDRNPAHSTGLEDQSSMLNRLMRTICFVFDVTSVA
jgi:hypothetical protein